MRINFTALVGHNQLASNKFSIIPVICFRELLLLLRYHDFSIYATAVLFLHKKSSKNPSNIAAEQAHYNNCFFELAILKIFVTLYSGSSLI